MSDPHKSEEQRATYDRRHLRSHGLQLPQLLAKVYVRAVEQDIEKGMRSTGVVAQLVCEPYALGVLILELGSVRAVGVVAHVAEDQSVGFEVVGRPWFDVVNLCDLQSFHAELLE